MVRKKNKKLNDGKSLEDSQKNSSEDKNRNPDVLVLPPNLLQKLGINLEKIQVDQSARIIEGVCESSTISEDTAKNRTCDDNSQICSLSTKQTSSITETAILMKESVLLSPTFHTMQISSDLHEVDESDVIKKIKAINDEISLDTLKPNLCNIKEKLNNINKSDELVPDYKGIDNSQLNTNLNDMKITNTKLINENPNDTGMFDTSQMNMDLSELDKNITERNIDLYTEDSISNMTKSSTELNMHLNKDNNTLNSIQLMENTIQLCDVNSHNTEINIKLATNGSTCNTDLCERINNDVEESLTILTDNSTNYIKQFETDLSNTVIDNIRQGKDTSTDKNIFDKSQIKDMGDVKIIGVKQSNGMVDTEKKYIKQNSGILTYSNSLNASISTDLRNMEENKTTNNTDLFVDMNNIHTSEDNQINSLSENIISSAAGNQLDTLKKFLVASNQTSELASDTNYQKQLDIRHENLKVDQHSQSEFQLQNFEYSDTTINDNYSTDSKLTHEGNVKHKKNKSGICKNKIKIISEEVIGLEKLDELNVLNCSTKKNIIPVSIDTIVTTKKRTHITKQVDVLLPRKKNTQHKIKNALKHDINHLQISSSEILKNEPIQIIETMDEKSITPFVDTLHHQNVFENIDNKNNKMPRLELNEVNNEGNKCVIIENDGVHFVEKSSRTKSNIVKSKLSVQGVEKPGGEAENKTGINISEVKTYINKKKARKVSCKLLPIEDFRKLLDIDLSDIDDVSTTNDLQNQQSQEFCICYDFGYLDKNGQCENYEHIHFWEKISGIMDYEILCSIYEDGENLNKRFMQETPDTDTKICFRSTRRFDLRGDAIPKTASLATNPIQSAFEISNIQNISLTHHNQEIHNTSTSLENLDKTELIEDCNLNITKTAGKSNDRELLNTVLQIKTQDESNLITNKKRKLSDILQEETNAENVCVNKKPKENKICDICKKEFTETELEDHIFKEHNSASTCNDDDKVNEFNDAHSNDEDDTPLGLQLVKCGVCQQELRRSQWIDHIAKEHEYLAWEHGQAIIDTNDSEQVKIHLNNIIKKFGSLSCSKCGESRKYVKCYLQHIRKCKEGLNDSLRISSPSKLASPLDKLNVSAKLELEISEEVRCGVCGSRMAAESWAEHARAEHGYLAWRDGDHPLDITNEDMVYKHLNKFCGEIGELMCSNCHIREGNVKVYQEHIKTCGKTNKLRENANEDSLPHNLPSNNNVYKCGVCKQNVSISKWAIHIYKEHNYIAWRDGESTVNVEDEENLHRHLNKLSKEIGGLICNKCGCCRKYVKSYLRHIRACDGSMNESQTNESMTDLDSSLDISLPRVKQEAENLEVRCGVCGSRMAAESWAEHARAEHGYLAWRDGDHPLDITDKDAVYQHLNRICGEIGELTCKNCHISEGDVKAYQEHMKTCEKSNQRRGNCINSKVQQEPPDNNEMYKCGVCEQDVIRSKWIVHICREHNYIAWKVGDPKINFEDEDEINQHLYNISKEIGGLVCFKCGCRRKYVKSYVRHVQTCDGNDDISIESILDPDISIIECDNEMAKCGVCEEEVNESEWLDHIATKHDYLAWKCGAPKINLSDDADVFDHLHKLSKKHGGLVCSKCGSRKKQVRWFLKHIKTCDGSLNVSISNENGDLSSIASSNSKVVECGVCGVSMACDAWWEHAQREHDYRAWRTTDDPLNLEDVDEVYQHLYDISKILGGLTCNKCGMTRKYVKTYLAHISTCQPKHLKEGILECGVCGENVQGKDWEAHAMCKHYNIAWFVGERPIDIKNIFEVEKYLKEYKARYNKLECIKCGLTRVSLAGFYAHVIQCGRTEEEIDQYKNFCNICNSKYLCIYKYQHVAMHREQDSARIRKQIKEDIKNREPDKEIPDGQRKAAVKAKTVIEKYKNSGKEGAYRCLTCDFSADNRNDIDEHYCELAFGGASDGEGSVKYFSSSSSSDGSSGEESDSIATADESDSSSDMRYKKKMKYDPSASLARIPFNVKNGDAFIQQSVQDFRETHLSKENLYHHWHTCQIENVSDDEVVKFMPPLEVSCNFTISGSAWMTLKLFGILKKDGYALFTGGCIQRISWTPPHVDDTHGRFGNFLAVSVHNGTDSPRHSSLETYHYSNMLQIWDFGDFHCEPKFVMGIAHDYGSIWDLDWCASGTRDVADNNTIPSRLGLLAIACSNGSAYILSVPYPSTRFQRVIKLKPAAELRLSRGERQSYQATSISWSKSKGHAIIIVGYSDGTVAFYNINDNSPLLSENEDGINIFYPYTEERIHNSCVTDVESFARGRGEGVGAWCGAGVTGALLRVGGAGLRATAAAAHAAFVPHWPAALLPGNNAIVKSTVNELDVQCGRRLGALRCVAPCALCGLMAAMTPPAIRLMQPHPVRKELHTGEVATIYMKPLVENKHSKNKKLKNDGLAIKLEPSTYESAAKVYGVDFRPDYIKGSKLHKPMEPCPEGFPLADVTSMAFCPTTAHHNYLAVAIHCGLIFLIKV